MKYNKQISIGYDAEGKRIRKWFHADTKAALEKQILDFKMEQAKVSNPSAITFGNYAKKWVKTYKSSKSNSTRLMYDNALLKFGNIDNLQLRKVTKTDCQKIINNHFDRPRTAQILRNTLNQIFNAAIDDGIIHMNPARNLEVPKHKPKEKRILTKKELEAVRSAALPKMERLFVNILLTFGLRPGEALALQQRDFDLSSNMLHIAKAVEYDINEASIKSTKTGASRDIPVPDQIKPFLLDYFGTNKSIWLFHQRDGSLMSKSSYKRMRERIISAINKALGGNSSIKMISGINMYTFRHNRATELYYLCQRGIISTKKAAALMGHSEAMFLHVYSHIDESQENTELLYEKLVL